MEMCAWRKFSRIKRTLRLYQKQYQIIKNNVHSVGTFSLIINTYHFRKLPNVIRLQIGLITR